MESSTCSMIAERARRRPHRVAMSPHAPTPAARSAAGLRRAGGTRYPHHDPSRAEPGQIATIGARYDGRRRPNIWTGWACSHLACWVRLAWASSDDDLRLMAGARRDSAEIAARVRALGRHRCVQPVSQAWRQTVVGTDGYNMDFLGELNAAR